MTREEIEDFIEKQSKIYHRNFMNYQESGLTRYERAAQKADELIDLANQALAAVDDHQMVGNLRSELSHIGNRAIRILHNRDENAMIQLLKDIKAIAKSYKLVMDPRE